MSERTGGGRGGDDDKVPSHFFSQPQSAGSKFLRDSDLHLKRPQTPALMDVQVVDRFGGRALEQMDKRPWSLQGWCETQHSWRGPEGLTSSPVQPNMALHPPIHVNDYQTMRATEERGLQTVFSDAICLCQVAFHSWNPANMCHVLLYWFLFLLSLFILLPCLYFMFLYFCRIRI